MGRSPWGRLELKRVCVCTVDEGYIGEWGAGGTENGQFWWPSGIARSGDGRFYITDEALQRVNVFDPDGNYIRHWGNAGDAPGQLNRPAAITIAPDDTLLISDGLNHRVQRFTVRWRVPGRLGRLRRPSRPVQYSLGLGLRY